MSAYNESDHPRDPRGQFANKPGASAASGVRLGGGEPRFDWRDPEFQNLTGPVPMLDGAIIEYDDGHQARIGVTDNGSYSTAQIYNPETGERMPEYIPSKPYRVVSCEADEERIHDEFKSVHLGMQALDNRDEMGRQRDEMCERFFDEKDTYTWNSGNIRADGIYALYYSNEDGSKAGRFLVDPETRQTALVRGSNTDSRRYKRLSKFVGSEEFTDEVCRLSDLEKEWQETYAESDRHSRAMAEKYGRRY